MCKKKCNFAAQNLCETPKNYDTMKKGTKITLIVLGVILGLGIVAFVSSDVLLSRLVKKEVDKSLAALPFGEASVGSIHLRLFSGTAQVNDIAFAYSPSLEIKVERIDVGRIFYSALMRRQVQITDIRIVEPQAVIAFDSKHPESFLPKMEPDTNALGKIAEFIDLAELHKLKIDRASLKFKDVATGLDLAVDSVTLRVYDLAFNVQDTTFSYNDSVYKLEVASFRCLIPDEPMRMEIHDVAHSDAGELTVGYTRIAHAIDKRKLGPLKKEPVTWIDMQIESVRTNPMNLIRKALAQDLSMDELAVSVKQMDVFRDTRFQPKKPYDMPQKILMQIPMTFAINHIDAAINKINVELMSTETNVGKLQLSGVKAEVEHMSNKRGSTMYVHGGCPVDKGNAKAEMRMTMNKAGDWSVKLDAKDVNTGFMNSFIRPLVGITSDCMIDELKADYNGNSVDANGTFCMLYHGLKVQVHKDDDIPYKIVTKNAGAINSAANTLIPKSNPSSVDVRPREYEVTWKRDEWQPFPLYLFGPCIDGVKKTMLPGLYVHKQVKNKTKKK
jgi:hypothetical protein